MTNSPFTTFAGIIAVILAIGCFVLFILGPAESYSAAEKILVGLGTAAVAALGGGLMAAKDDDSLHRK